MTDGPLIVQSDKTLLLEVDHPLPSRPGAHRALRRARARPRAHPHLPAHAAGAVERARRRARRRAVSSTRCCATPGTPSRTPCSSTWPTRWTATAGCSCSSTRRTGWCWRPPTAPCSRRCCAARRSSRWSARASTRTPWPCTRPSAGTLKQVLLKLGWPAEDLAGYVDGEAHADRRCARTAGRCATTSARPPRASGTAAPGVVVLPCGAGKTHRRRRGDGHGQGDHADPGHQHRLGAPVARRAARSAPRSPRTRSASTPGARKEIRPVTIATYQVMTTRRKGVYPTSSCSTPATGA